MPGISASITVKGMREVQRMLLRVTQSAASHGGRTGLHARFAILATRWIDRNFQSEGVMTGTPWARLKPMTVMGRRKGSSRVLQDKGLMRASFHPQWDDKAARVGNPMKISEYHEKGTGTFGPKGQPYIIEPKPGGKALAWKVAGPLMGATVSGLTFFRSAEVGKKFGKGFSSLRTKTTYKRGENIVFARRVIHPGVPIRRMLPRMGEPTLMPELLRAALNYVKEQERAREQGT